MIDNKSGTAIYSNDNARVSTKTKLIAGCNLSFPGLNITPG